MVRPRRIAPLTGPAPTHLHPCSQDRSAKSSSSSRVESLISNHAVASHGEQAVAARRVFSRGALLIRGSADYRLYPPQRWSALKVQVRTWLVGLEAPPSGPD